jgi:hypothetical protein
LTVTLVTEPLLSTICDPPLLIVVLVAEPPLSTTCEPP